MPYDSSDENIALLKRTIIGAFDVSGRSRRTELVYYAIAITLLNIVIDFAALVTLSWTASLIVELIFRLLLFVPFFALFARRLHDQNRSAWWALMLPVIVAMNIMQTVKFIIAGTEIKAGTYYSYSGTPLDVWIGVPLTLAYLVLAFLPGTDGANRFGPDPRLD